MKFLAYLGLAAAAITPVSAEAATSLSGTMTADNVFFAFLGTSASALGTPVGSGASWTSAFALTPTALTPGVTNYLNIEAINQGGPGALSFVLNLSGTGFHFANGAQVLTTDPANLGAITATYNSGASAGVVQPWMPATGAVVPGSYPWGNIVGTPNWADAAVSGLGQCSSCTVDFTVAILPDAVPEPSAWALFGLGLGLTGAALRRRTASLGRQATA